MPKLRGTKRPGPTSVRLSKDAGDALREVARVNKTSLSDAMGQALLWFAENELPSLCKPDGKAKEGAK